MLSVLKKYNLLLLIFTEAILVVWGLSGTDDLFSFLMAANVFVMYLSVSFGKYSTESLLARFLPYAILLLIFICGIQHFNYNIKIVTYEGYTSSVALDYINWLPTSVFGEYYKGNALRSLIEVGSTLSFGLVCLLGFTKHRILFLSLGFWGINIALMGAYAIYQKYHDIPIIYNYFYTTADFYGSFPLSNAAGAFLNMGCAINLAMSIMTLKNRNYIFSLIWFLLATLCSGSAYYSGSVGAGLFAIAFWLILFPITAWYVISKYYTKIVATISVVVGIVLFITAGVFTLNSYHFENAKEYQRYTKNIEESLSSRFSMYDLSKKIISRNLFFGSGGNSCQYLLTQEMVKSRDVKKSILASSTFHAHSDPLEYVMEFGIVGGVIIIVCLLFWIRDFFKSSPNFESLILLIGAILCLLHSCIDMHLHILSSMLLFALLVAASITVSNKSYCGKNE